MQKSDSIIFECSSGEVANEVRALRQKTSLMGNVPLLLEKRKEGIIEDNMMEKDPGL